MIMQTWRGFGLNKKRIVIDWIKTVGTCNECGNEIYMERFYITNTWTRNHCVTCQKSTMHTVIAHEVSLLEEIKDIE